jgi:pimeloyl-ACP methyl ester carboxylesterase
MATFVLVHGAWHGGWCWTRVRRALLDQGHEVLAPTLTGLCERSHLLSRDVDLKTHIDDVANLIRWRELSDVVLCGHSYGGCVISGAADLVPERLAALVYLDAFVPEAGQSLHDTLPPEVRQQQLDLADEFGEGWRVPPIPAEVFNVNPADRAWVDSQCTPQPLATFQQALPPGDGRSRVATNHYIYAADWDGSPFTGFYEQAKARGWAASEIACGHDVMLDRPDALTGQLIDVAQAARVR